MSKIYVIMGASGEYSSYNTWTVCATYTPEKAQEIIDKINATLSFYNDFIARIADEFDAHYRIPKHPNPPKPKLSQEYHALREAQGRGQAFDRKRLFFLQSLHDKQMANWKAECSLAAKLSNTKGAHYEQQRQEFIKENYRIPDYLKETADLLKLKEPKFAKYDEDYFFEEVEIL